MLLRILMTFIFIKWHRCRGKIVIRALELVTTLDPGARFSKVSIINGSGKLSPFTLKIEVSIVLHLT